MKRLYFQIGVPEISGAYRTRLDLPLPITMEAIGDNVFITSGKGLEPAMILTQETHFRSERELYAPALAPACHAGVNLPVGGAK